MKTNLDPKFAETETGQEAESILRSCVHCGFCNATCPTYRELGDERDGPRGRIYLIKQLLETAEASDKTRNHLDKCLTCHNCETTCPSGVRYGKLLDIGRRIIDEVAPRPVHQQIVRWGFRQVLPFHKRFSSLLKLGQFFRPIMPRMIKTKIPLHEKSGVLPTHEQLEQNKRTMLLLAGCAQPSATPNTNASAKRVFNRLGISLIEAPKAGCCGAVSYHLGAHEEGLGFMRRNIDAWWPQIESGVEAIVITASGCGTMVKEYGDLLKDDAQYAEKAQRVSELMKDLSEILINENLTPLGIKSDGKRIAVHCPCTLQHGLTLPDNMAQILGEVGLSLTKAKEKNLCCGSAGTYSLLQPKMSQELLKNKLTALMVDNPDRIVTANIGCQLHLASKANVPVQHWIELLEQ